MNEKICLILGGYGFLGTYVARKFKNEGYQIIGFGHNNYARYTNIYDFNYYDDITKESLEAIGCIPKIIVNCAGSSSVSRTASDCLAAFRKTVECNHIILEYISKIKKSSTKYIYISSAAVYGDTGNMNITENDGLKPVSLYGEYKVLSEDLCRYYFNNIGISTCIIRPFSISGIGLKKQLLWDACNKITENIYDFFGNGKEKRDWIDVRDVADLIFKVALDRTHSFEILNACSGLQLTNKEFLSYLFERLNAKSKNLVFNGKIDINNPINLVGSNSKAQKLYHWQPKYSWKEIIDNYTEWYLNLNRKQEEIL